MVCAAIFIYICQSLHQSIKVNFRILIRKFFKILMQSEGRKVQNKGVRGVVFVNFVVNNTTKKGLQHMYEHMYNATS